MERLREFFAKRGVTVGAQGLVVFISANAVQAAPVGLAATLSTAAVLAGTTLTTTASGFSTTLTKLMASTKVKMAGITLALGLGAGTWISVQERAIAETRDEHRALRTRATALNELRAEDERLAKLAREAELQFQSEKQRQEIALSRSRTASFREQLQQLADRRKAARMEPAATPQVGADVSPKESFQIAAMKCAKHSAARKNERDRIDPC